MFSGQKQSEDIAVPETEEQLDNPVIAEEVDAACDDSMVIELEDARAQLAQFETDIGELENKYLRKQADFENFRRRLERDKIAAIEFANSALLGDLISVIDNLERAMAAVNKKRDYESLREGVVLIEKQFIDMLERKWHLSRFESAGTEFDPDRHEAVISEEIDGIDCTTVLEEYQKGYVLHNRVLRTAKVKVGVPKDGPTESIKDESHGE